MSHEAKTVKAPKDAVTTKEKKTRDPLFHIIKRSELVWWKGWLIRLCAILAAMLLSGLLVLFLTKLSPVTFFTTMFHGVFGTKDNFMVVLEEVAVLLCVSLAVTPAFKMRFWNTGAEGQALIGGLATAICMFYLKGTMPPVLLIVVMFVSSLVAGALWGMIPAIFKAKWGTNETLFTLMMNYVAMQLIQFFMNIWNKKSASIDYWLLDPEQKIYSLIGSKNALVKCLFSVIIVAIVTALIFVYLKYSKHGYEISVVGESENTARYIGINVKKVIIRTMILSGAICGLAGFLLVGTSQSISPNTLSGRGFTAIMVSWLAKFSPFTMIFSAFLFVFLQTGAHEVATLPSLEISTALSDIVLGIFLFLIIGCEFFVQYKVLPGARLKKLFAGKAKKTEEVAK
ncbi:MAG: ABC transporter permease [Clostridia bacterium]|nr:ABC transporter permease [Clostridia bacterium]